MVDLEPFKYQASTNIKEHNEIVDKVNEIVGVINDINLDGLEPRLTADEANIKKNTDDITQLKISDTEHTAEITTLESNVDNHAREITAIKAVDAKQSSDIAETSTIVDALTKELPTEITLYRDGEGKIKAQVTKEDNTTFDSNVLDMIIPYQYDIISGTSARSFKLDITTSDGNHIVTNDFLIPEGGGTDVTITSVTLQKDPTNANRIKVSIGLSDGTPLESGYATLVNAVSGTFANNKLTITVNGVSSVPITIDTTGTVYSPGTGIKIASGTISVDGTVVALKADISDMETKTRANATFETKSNASATYATKTALNNLQNSVGDAFTEVAIGADGKSLDFTALDGQVNNITLPSSGGSDLDANKVNVIINDIFNVTELKTKLNISETGKYNLIGIVSISSYSNTYGDDPTFINYINCITLEVESSAIYVKSNGPSIVRRARNSTDDYYLGVGFYYNTDGNTSFKYLVSYGTTVVYNISTTYKRKGMELTGILYKIE